MGLECRAITDRDGIAGLKVWLCLWIDSGYEYFTRLK
jgi:hypothetical protein